MQYKNISPDCIYIFRWRQKYTVAFCYVASSACPSPPRPHPPLHPYSLPDPSCRLPCTVVLIHSHDAVLCRRTWIITRVVHVKRGCRRRRWRVKDESFSSHDWKWEGKKRTMQTVAAPVLYMWVCDASILCPLPPHRLLWRDADSRRHRTHPQQWHQKSVL